MIQKPILIPGELNSIGDKSASSFDQRWYVLNSRKLIYVFGSAHVKIGRSTAVIPGWAGREERLSRSELCQPFRIDSDAVLHMNLIRLMWSTLLLFEF